MTDISPDLASMDAPHGREPTNDLWEAMFSQRAIRYWKDKPVPRELLEKVVLAGSKAPSGSNMQPWVFVIIDEEEKRLAVSNALRDRVGESEMMQQLMAEGKKSDDKSVRLMMNGAEAFFNQLGKAPALIVPCLYNLASPTNDPTTLHAGSSIYLAVQNMLLAARGLGLGTVMTTAQDSVDDVLRAQLNLPDDAHPVALIPIGYPEAKFGKTKRKQLSEILRFNAW